MVRQEVRECVKWRDRVRGHCQLPHGSGKGRKKRVTSKRREKGEGGMGTLNG